MKFISTRGYEGKFSAQEAIVKGIAPDGGLFVPETIPVLTDDDIEQMKNMRFFSDIHPRLTVRKSGVRIRFLLYSLIHITRENTSSNCGTALRVRSRMSLCSFCHIL